jgi:hypothetical protein
MVLFCQGGNVLKCFIDGRKRCETFNQMPNWVGNNWLAICRNCPKGKEMPIDTAKILECTRQYEDSKLLYPLIDSVEERIRFLGFEPDLVPDLVAKEASA